MNTNSRNSLLATTLNPNYIKIDGRSDLDRLAFLAKFAKLILFYDQNNKPNGDWRPFLLKDPIILLAYISKTDYLDYHDKFVLLKQNKAAMTDVVFANQLCSLLQKIFTEIHYWFHFMELDANAYQLYIFLHKTITDKLADQLALMITLQQYLCSITHGQVIQPEAFYNDFASIWKTWINSHPEVSNIDQAFQLLEDVYYDVLDVFVQIVDHVKQDFENNILVTDHPDTALLITFSHLMETHRNQINQFSHKHLDFYYNSVLKLSLRPAQPDDVYVCLSLPNKTDSLSLPALTQFKAGVYPDGSDILFINKTAADFNQAAISQTYTLYYDQNKTVDSAALYLNQIPNVSQVSRNTLQEILSWDAFGNTNGQTIQQGFAFASPMLFLQGGSRTITISFEFESNPPKADSTVLSKLFSDCQFYLSTEKAWIQVKGAVAPPKANSASMAIQLNLSASDPAIVAFTKNPDGFTSSWPMFKVMLGQSADLLQPPNLLSVTIHVNVEQLTQLSIANDLATTLPNTGSVSIFGPIPELGSCFYVGSHECFAKPMNSLSLTMNWDQLPAKGFDDYYATYNAFLTGGDDPKPGQELFDHSAFTGQWQLLTHQCGTNSVASLTPNLVSLFQSTKSDSITPNPQSTFHFKFNQNSTSTAYPELILAPLPAIGLAKNGYLCFELKTPQFAFGQSLYAKVVVDVSMKNANTLMAKNKVSRDPHSTLIPVKAEISTAIAKEADVVAKQAELDAKKTEMSFATKLMNLIQRLISILRSPSKTAPTAAPVPRNIAPPPQNKDGFLEMPNPPYSPKQSSLSIDYEATSTTAISRTCTASAYPFELYHYGTFVPYLAYDAQDADKGCGFANLTPKLPKGSAAS